MRGGLLRTLLCNVFHKPVRKAAFGQYAVLMMRLYQVWAEVLGGKGDC